MCLCVCAWCGLVRKLYSFYTYVFAATTCPQRHRYQPPCPHPLPPHPLFPTHPPGASSLTMTNVPFHEDVKAFCAALAAAAPAHLQYALAGEHEHSCCVLLARRDKFMVNGQWHTWIDYEKFHVCVVCVVICSVVGVQRGWVGEVVCVCVTEGRWWAESSCTT